MRDRNNSRKEDHATSDGNRPCHRHIERGHRHSTVWGASTGALRQRTARRGPAAPASRQRDCRRRDRNDEWGERRNRSRACGRAKHESADFVQTRTRDLRADVPWYAKRPAFERPDGCGEFETSGDQSRPVRVTHSKRSHHRGLRRPVRRIAIETRHRNICVTPLRSSALMTRNCSGESVTRSVGLRQPSRPLLSKTMTHGKRINRGEPCKRHGPASH